MGFGKNCFVMACFFKWQASVVCWTGPAWIFFRFFFGFQFLGRLKSSVEEKNEDGDILLRRYHSNDRSKLKLLELFYGTDIMEIIWFIDWSMGKIGKYIYIYIYINYVINKNILCLRYIWKWREFSRTQHLEKW